MGLKTDIKTVFKKGKTANSSLLLIKSLKMGQSPNEYTIVVSNKISKKATVRNQIKRRIRYWLQTNKKTQEKGQKIVIIAKKPIISADYSQIKDCLEKCLK